jgi:hypothetical protein
MIGSLTGIVIFFISFVFYFESLMSYRSIAMFDATKKLKSSPIRKLNA